MRELVYGKGAQLDPMACVETSCGDVSVEFAAYSVCGNVLHDQHLPSTKPLKASSRTRAMLNQISGHNSYHVGQVALLRRQLDTWPPQRGGDNW